VFKKIKRIKKLGIFSDYSWEPDLKKFNQYNLIYGWNGSGKTTLTNLFAAIKKGTSDKYPDLEYEIETESDSIKQGEVFSKKVRVFNRSYVSNNIQLLDGKAKPIFILGEENKIIAEEIEKDEDLLKKKIEELKEIIREKERLRTLRDSSFTNIATTISSIETGQATRNYRKNNAELTFDSLSAKELLDELDVGKYTLTLRQSELPIETELSIQKLSYQDDEGEKEELGLDDILKRILIKEKNLLTQTAESM